MGKDILEIITNDVEEQANLVIDQINREIEQLHNEQITYFEEGLKKEQETYLEKELNDLRVFSVTECSRAKLQTKRDLLNLRQDLVNSLFGDVKKRLLAFVASKDYEKYITTKLNSITVDGGKIYCKEEDFALVKKVLKSLKLEAEIVKDYLEIGGLKYVNKAENLEYDFTLDNAFEEQTEWFINSSGFTI